MKFKDLFAVFGLVFLLMAGCDDGVGIGNNNNNNFNDNNSNQNNNFNDNTNNQNNNNVNTNPDLIITYSEVYPDATEIVIFKEDEWIASVELENTATEAVVVEQLLFYMSEPSPWEVKNAKLYIGAGVVASLPDNETAGFHFRPDVGVVIGPGAKTLFNFRAEIVGGLCKNANTPYMATAGENLVRGQVSGDYFTFTASDNPVLGNVTRKIVGNAMTVGPGPDNPPAGDIVRLSQDAIFLQLSLFAGESMNIVGLNYSFTAQFHDQFSDFKVWTKNSLDEWIVVAGPTDSVSWVCNGGTCQVALDDAFDIGKCEELLLTTTLDVGSLPPTGVTAEVTLDASSGIEAVYNNTGIPLPSEHFIYLGDPNIWSNPQNIVP